MPLPQGVEYTVSTPPNDDPEKSWPIPVKSAEDASLGEVEVTVSGPSLHPVDAGFHAWAYLASAWVLDFFIWSLPFSYGVFLNYYISVEFPDEPSSLLALVGSLSNGIMYLSSPILLPLMNRYPRTKTKVMVVGYVICVAGLVGGAFVKTAGGLIVTQGVMYSVGGSLLYFPMMTYLFEWFSEKLGLANGILFSGASVGGVIGPFLIQALLEKYGRKVTLLSLGITLFILIGPCFFFLKPRLPVPQSQDTKPKRWFSRKYFRFLYLRTFWILLSATMVQSLGNFMPFLYLPNFASELHLSNTVGTLGVSLINGASAPGMIFMGWLSDRFDLRISMTLSCVGSSLAVFLLWGMSGSLVPYIVFACVYGFLGTTYVALFPRFVSATIGHDPKLSPTLLAIFMAVRGIGNILSAPISSALIRPWALTGKTELGYGVGGYGPLIIFTGATVLAGGLGILYKGVSRRQG
ncbi:MFS general substrate transporter [Dendrothele bispora CBS 962.96]|uniref:MFS general substrate transporter n=1 Tax=Dendrothele bispora (strain CBS 962.96) TaxID=1314807 RepID=A0A4S8M0E2_DENBC|nr:MFS general substrate transporter [Dendrothele bispora CBS 962.96]